MPFQVPTPVFSPWKLFKNRDRPSRDGFDVPADYGLRGVYVMASAVAVPAHSSASQHLNPAVIYIGESCQGVEQRLEKHEMGRRFKGSDASKAGELLWFSVWHAHRIVSTPGERIADEARVRALERILISEFAEAFGKLPLQMRR